MAYFLIFLLLLGSAFVSGTEIAYTSLSKLKMKRDSENPSAAQKLVGFIYNHYDYALSTVLVGNNLVNIGATSVATVLAVNLAVRMDGRIGNLSLLYVHTVHSDRFAVLWEENKPFLLRKTVGNRLYQIHNTTP